MFEKEAEEYAQGMAMYYKSAHGSIPSQFEKYLRKAVEFGYNKANEWQYVSEKGTPKTEGHYLVCLRNKDKDILDCWILYDKDVGWYSMQIRIKDIYAWKEIVPPKEITE